MPHRKAMHTDLRSRGECFTRLRFRLYAILSSGEFADGTYQFNSRSDPNQRECGSPGAMVWRYEAWPTPKPGHSSAEVRVR